MGTIISAIRKELEAADAETRDMAKDTLRQLDESSKFILDGMQTKIFDEYKNPETVRKWKVVGGRIDRTESFVSVATSNTPGSSITEGVQHLISG
jgi:hypothetical protein